MIGSRSGIRVFTTLAFGAMALLATPLATRAQVSTKQNGKQSTMRLRVTTWNLAGSLPAKLARRFERRKAVWRTSFGPRKTKASGPKSRPPNIDADVIALQSVRDMRIVRRLFPARQYHVIVSRQLLLNAERIAEQRAPANRPAIAPNDTASSATTSGVTAQAPATAAKTITTAKTIGTTAIAIRRASRIRLTRQEHLITFAGISLRDRKLPYRAAAVALRLSRGGKILWVLSLDLIEGCGTTRDEQPSQSCAIFGEQIDLLTAWLKTKRALGEKVIIAGSFGRPLQYTAAALNKTADAHNIWSALNSGKADPNNRKLIVARAGTASVATRALQRSSRFPLPPAPDTATSPAKGQRLIGFPAKPVAGCAKNSQTMSDYILADIGKTVSRSASSKGWRTAYPDARHCPITLDIAF